MRRRTILIGAGSTIAAGGALLGTGAFTTVQAQRTVSIDVAADSEALVGIDVNDRYGGETDDGVAEFDLDETVFDESGLNPDGMTVLFAALGITNNSGNDDLLEVQLSYDSESVEVPDGQAVPGTDPEGQFYLRAFDESNTPDSGDIFEGLAFDGDASAVADPGAIATGETTVFDLVIDPGGELDTDAEYAVDVTISATLTEDS